MSWVSQLTENYLLNDFFLNLDTYHNTILIQYLEYVFLRMNNVFNIPEISGKKSKFQFYITHEADPAAIFSQVNFFTQDPRTTVKFNFR